jgi:hypothetical protein
MTREEFKKRLDSLGYSYKEEGDKIVVDDYNDFVFLGNLKSLPPMVIFENGGGIFLNSLTTISPGVEFKNPGTIWLESLIGRISWSVWKGNIKGIDPNRLLNKMISLGLFDRK